MHCYGSTRHDAARCLYGCCGGKLIHKYKGSNPEKASRRAIRKRARRKGRLESAQVLTG